MILLRVLTALSLIAAAHGADPLVGVWEMNPAKSAVAGQALPKSIRETIREDPRGLRIRREMVNRDGKSTDQAYLYVFDGKDHPADLGVDAKHTHHTMRFAWKGPGVIEREVNHDHGKVISLYRHTVSADGKTLTVLRSGNDDGTGKPYRVTLVFDRR